MTTQPRTCEVVPVTVVREGAAYRVPRHPASLDLYLDGNEGKAPPADLLEHLVGRGTDALFRYPSAGSLEALLAERLGVQPGQILVTAGADDGIDRICRTMLSEGREALIPWPTFEMLVRYASVAGGRVTKVTWTPGEPFPVDAMIAQATPDTGLLMMVSPNNPTGSVVTAAQVRRLSEALPHVLLLLDLAYVEFADEDLTALALELPNLAVTRTLSKAWGLAGLRVGYVVASENIVGWLRVAGEPYAVAGPSLLLAEERVKTGQDEVDAFRRFVRDTRTQLESQLRERGLEVIPSQGNFVFANVPDSLWLRDGMAGLGIGVRAFPGKPGLERGVRITCPRDRGQFRRLTHALDTILAPEALLFDMDGVLADVSGSYRQAIVGTAAAFGVTLSAEEITRAKEAGNANNDWILTQRMLAERGVEASLEEVTRIFEELYQGTHTRAGLWETERLLLPTEVLARLAERRPLAVVTGRPRRDAVRFLEQHGIGSYFLTLVCMEDGPAKPDPAPVLTALEELGVRTAWLLGDTPDDIRAARGAHVLPIGLVAPGDHAEETAQALRKAGAARVLAQPADLEEWLS